MGTPWSDEMILTVDSRQPSPDAHAVGLYDGGGAEWDAFVRSCAEPVPYTHCHLYGWRRVMQVAMGHDAPYLVARNPLSGTISGVLPLVRIRSRLFGHFLVSMPFLNYGGPLGDSGAIRQLAAHAAEMARAEGATLVELRSRAAIPLGDPFQVSHRKITVVMDSRGGSDCVWKRLPSKVRSQVRRPIKEGVSVAIGMDQLGPFYKVFARHMRDLGTPVMSRRFFEMAAREFADDAVFAVAYLKGVPIACGGGFLCGTGNGREFEIVWASALREYNRIAPNMLIYWELMRHVADCGAQKFNFGRCTPGGNTHRFKTQWGTTDEPLHWYDYSPSGAHPIEADSTAARGATMLWTRMPLVFANAIGPQIVRLIPL